MNNQQENVFESIGSGLICNNLADCSSDFTPIKAVVQRDINGWLETTFKNQPIEHKKNGIMRRPPPKYKGKQEKTNLENLREKRALLLKLTNQKEKNKRQEIFTTAASENLLTSISQPSKKSINQKIPKKILEIEISQFTTQTQDQLFFRKHMIQPYLNQSKKPQPNRKLSYNKVAIKNIADKRQQQNFKMSIHKGNTVGLNSKKSLMAKSIQITKEDFTTQQYKALNFLSRKIANLKVNPK